MAEVDILGPFLCRPTSSSMSFWFCSGPKEVKSIEVTVSGTNNIVKLDKVASEKSHNAWIGETTKPLGAGATYSYTIKIDGNPYLPLGFETKDLTFSALPDDPSKPLDFILMSCHGIEAWEKDPKKDKNKSWDMWIRLEKELKNYPACRLGILGGDQVYMDDTFKEDLSDYDESKPEIAHDRFLKAYFKYWQHPSYRRIMAKIPCFLMWDDHDIIDGWGSREEATKGREASKWTKYFAQAKNAFHQMQASRNPKAVDKDSSFSFISEFGDKAFLALDMRSNRKITGNETSEMMSEVEKEKIAEALSKLPSSIKQLFIISPVTVARMGGNIEGFLGNFSNFLWSLGAWLSYKRPKVRASFWALVSAILYWINQLNTPNFPGITQSAILVVIGIFLLARSSDVSQYLPEHKGLIKTAFVLLLALGLVGISVALAVGFRRIDQSLVDSLEASISRAWFPALWSSAMGISFSWLAIASFSIKKANNWPWAGKLGIVFTMGLLGVSLFLGLPGKEITYGNALGIFCMLVVGLLSILTFLLSVLEITGNLDMIAGLDDDIRDGWSSHANKGDLNWLSKQVVKLKSKGIENLYILCGDIHTGGLSTIKFKTDDGSAETYQVTSSPMSYVPMEPMVEKVTSGIQPVPLEPGPGVSLECTNIFYRSVRNFAIIQTSSKNCRVDFFFEDLNKPVSIALN